MNRVAPGSIVMVASTLGLRPAPGRLAYAATKAALISMTRSLALELAPRRVYEVYHIGLKLVRAPLRQADGDRTIGIGKAVHVAQIAGHGFVAGFVLKETLDRRCPASTGGTRDIDAKARVLDRQAKAQFARRAAARK